MASDAGVRVERDGGIVRITIDRPDKRNSLHSAAMAALADAVVAAGTDETARVVVLAGTGKHFCAGADLVSANPDKRSSGPPKTGHMERSLAQTPHRLMRAIWELELPVVSVVQGHAAGIGCNLALVADFCVAARTAVFTEPFTRIGFTPDSAGSFLLPRLVGLSRAKEMLLLGRPIDGAQAADWGLITAAVDEDKLAEESEALIAELASAATLSVGLAKLLVHRNLAADMTTAMANEAMAVELSIRSRDFKEGIAAFKEKRQPKFEGG